MRFWKHSLLSAAVFMGITSTVTYTSCTNDSCQTLICRNGGTCSDEQCLCPDGYEGTQCDVVSRSKFRGSYAGNTKVNQLPVIVDTAWVEFSWNENDSLGLRTRIKSRLPEVINGYAVKNDVIVTEPAGKNISYKMTGDNKIEIQIDEMVDGERVISTFIGTKYE